MATPHVPVTLQGSSLLPLVLEMQKFCIDFRENCVLSAGLTLVSQDRDYKPNRKDTECVELPFPAHSAGTTVRGMVSKMTQEKSIIQNDTCTQFHCSTIYNSQDLEAT